MRMDGPDGKSYPAWQQSAIMHFNPDFIRWVDEKRMYIMMDDGTTYKVDEESLQLFLSIVYGIQSTEKLGEL